jgi:hypothetical protein
VARIEQNPVIDAGAAGFIAASPNPTWVAGMGAPVPMIV